MRIQQTLRIASLPKFRRRDLLRFMGGTTVVSLLGCFKKPPSSAEEIENLAETAPSNSTSAEPLDCMVRPQQTEGPYFVDEDLNRSDIRADPSDGSVKQGVPLRLAFHVSQLNTKGCVPLEGAIVDIWHCDASGVYSDVVDRNFNTKGQKFLRGSQITNANGMVEFVTIYPGWYPGRTVHIHFKIRRSENSQPSYEFTSQLYFDDALTDQVMTQSPYNQRGPRNTLNDNDGIFRGGGEQLKLQLIQDLEGYVGRFTLGLKIE